MQNSNMQDSIEQNMRTPSSKTRGLHLVRHVELDIAKKSEDEYDRCIKIEACNFFFYFFC